ncbi:MAG TPA: hypothetical protein VHG71_08945 [Verrucomicrobiae bacterium]|nr:hypothetical protein [Verrucomicrobiae bacterium]
MNATTILSILGTLGLGGLISSYLTILWQRRNENKAKHQEYKESRYKCIILLMHAYMNFEQNKDMLIKHGYEIQSKKDLAELLRTEHINSFLFASDDFIKTFQIFIETPTEENIRKVALAIRKDLWGLKTHL